MDNNYISLFNESNLAVDSLDVNGIFNLNGILGNFPVDNITIVINLSNQLEVPDGGITDPKIVSVSASKITGEFPPINTETIYTDNIYEYSLDEGVNIENIVRIKEEDGISFTGDLDMNTTYDINNVQQLFGNIANLTSIFVTNLDAYYNTLTDVSIYGIFKADSLNELTLDSGVTIESNLLKDNQITTDKLITGNIQTIGEDLTIDGSGDISIVANGDIYLYSSTDGVFMENNKTFWTKFIQANNDADLTLTTTGTGKIQLDGPTYSNDILYVGEINKNPSATNIEFLSNIYVNGIVSRSGDLSISGTGDCTIDFDGDIYLDSNTDGVFIQNNKTLWTKFIQANNDANLTITTTGVGAQLFNGNAFLFTGNEFSFNADFVCDTTEISSTLPIKMTNPLTAGPAYLQIAGNDTDLTSQIILKDKEITPDNIFQISTSNTETIIESNNEIYFKDNVYIARAADFTEQIRISAESGTCQIECNNQQLFIATTAGSAAPINMVTDDANVNFNLGTGVVRVDEIQGYADQNEVTVGLLTINNRVFTNKARVSSYYNTTVSVSSGSNWALTFNNDDYIDGINHAGTSFTKPASTTTSVYLISYTIYTDGATSGDFITYLAKNGAVSSSDPRWGQVRNAFTGADVYNTGSAHIEMASGDVLRVYVFQNTGGNRNIGSATVSKYNRIQIIEI